MALLSSLSFQEKQKLEKQLACYPPHLKAYQQILLGAGEDLSSFSVLDPEELRSTLQPSTAWKVEGEKLVYAGKVASIILAGGSASRLKSALPKALFSLGSGKTLLQHFCEKIASYSSLSSSCIQVAIMNSQESLEEIKKHLEKNHFFGLEKNPPFLFSQPSLPLLSRTHMDASQEDWLIDRTGKIIEGPSGNGELFQAFCKNGDIIEKWKKAGVEWVQILSIDNPLADPLDPLFTGYTACTGSSFCIKGLYRASHLPLLGVLGRRQGKLSVREYFTISSQEIGLPYYVGNMNRFCIPLDMITNLSNLSLPLHPSAKEIFLEEIPFPVWKFERFLFDALPYIEKSNVYIDFTQTDYYPLKRREDAHYINKYM